jgi:hypothetical protein
MRSGAASPRSQRRGAPSVQEEVPEAEGQRTPRAQSPDRMTVAEEKVINELLAHTPNRTSYAPSTLEADYQNTHYHDLELCILLHALDDPNQHEVAKKALRKGVRQRVKRLGIKYDHEVRHDSWFQFDGWCVLMSTLPSLSSNTESRSTTTTRASMSKLSKPR